MRAALNAGCSYYNQGGTAGGSTYPHTYNNYEGFDFAVSGPYQEFPLQSGGAYDGGMFLTRSFSSFETSDIFFLRRFPRR